MEGKTGAIIIRSRQSMFVEGGDGGRTEELGGIDDSVQDGHVSDRHQGAKGESEEEGDAPGLVFSLVEPRLLFTPFRQ